MFNARLAVAIAVPTAAVALAAAGCGGSSSSSSETGGSAGQSSGSAGGGGSTLKLSADPGGALKFNISSLSAKSGKLTLQMKNPASSGIQHGIAVEGNGVDQDGPIVNAGGTSTLSVNLKPGKYEFYCPVDAHKQQGMEGTLTVQ
jgi:uncharacterized cupredoxin-like copper-binding protein